MKFNLSTKTKGIWSATGVVFTQGLEAILLPFLLFAIFMQSSKENHGISFASVVMSIKEFISLVIICSFLGIKVIKSSFKLITKKKNFIFILSGVIGTGLGNLFFITGIILAGPAYGVILSAFYPVFAILFNKIFFNEKDNWIVKLGVVITIIGGLLFVILPVILKETNKNLSKNNLYIGMFCGLVSGLFWALEGVLLKKAMQKNKKVTKKEIIVIRTFSVTIASFLLFLPISMIIDTSINKKFYNIFTELYYKIFADKQAWIVWTVLILAGLNIVILRILHTTAIEKIGQKMTAIIDTNNFIIPSIFSVLLKNIMKVSPVQKVFADSQLDPWYLWFILIPLSIGLLLVMWFHGVEDPPNFKKIITEKIKNIKNKK
ncbi:MAG: EamA family transporter [Mycoplasma sp.]|nr:EamA family transporter [Mycoplasma sp.]